MKLAWPLVEEIRRLAAAYGKTPAQVALNWLVRDPWIYPIPGAVWFFWLPLVLSSTLTKLGVIVQYCKTLSDSGLEKMTK